MHDWHAIYPAASYPPAHLCNPRLCCPAVALASLPADPEEHWRHPQGCRWRFLQLVKCTIYLADMADFAAMNAVYATFFNVPKPAARAAFAAAGLPKAAKVEIECNAVV